MRTPILLALPALLAFGAARAACQDLANLAGARSDQAYRASSADPTGRNGDARSIAPGETLVLADLAGPGKVTHIWFTIASPSPDHLRELVLRMSWDGASRPAVEAPIGEFFAQGPGAYVEFTSSAVSVGARNALNCYWPMPYRKRALITVTNEGSKRVGAFYYNIDYSRERRAARDLRYFHTQFHTYFPAPVGRDLTICESKGAGHYVGTVVSVLANSDGWWGEGDDNFTVDGADRPQISGTGTEDYFCGAWDWQRAHWTPYFGVTYFNNDVVGGEKRGVRNTAFRWHIPDPVTFRRSLRFTLEHGRQGWDRDRKPLTNHYTTVAYYYLDAPGGEGPPIPPYRERVPVLLPLPPSAP